MNYRQLFDGIEVPVKLEDGSSIVPINFDNGATTPPLKSVTELIIENIKNYGPIARGTGQKGDICTTEFEEARKIILDFFNLGKLDTHTVVFTKSTTEGINILSKVLKREKNEIVLTTRMEHHANDLPWRFSGNVEYVEVDEMGRINIEDIENKLIENKGLIKYVSITAASNVTGYLNPINDIARLCHKYGAKIIVDAAQIVAHKEVNMKGKKYNEQIDFLVFSGHKIYAPFGCGAIVGLKQELSDVDPFLKGGGCVKGVFDKYVIWDDIPKRLEAGTQNFFGAISMAKAMKDLKKIGFNNIYNHEMDIKNHIIRNMKNMENIIIYGDSNNINDRLGVITFNIENKDYEYVAKKLANESGIALRCGKFCAHPYVFRLLGVSDLNGYIDVINDAEDYGTVRASLGLYNTMKEANIFLDKLEDIIKK